MPPADGAVPPEALELYGDRFSFVAAGVGVGALRHDNYVDALTRLPAAVDALVARGARAIGIMGTSLTFALGRGFDDTVARDITARTGLPATTMASSIVAALRAVGARRVALATAYDEAVTQRLSAFLTDHGFVVTGAAQLGIVVASEVRGVTTADIVALGRRAVEAERPDALVISCGGLRTIDATLELESELDLPVVSSSVAGPWGAVRLLGDDGAAVRAGRLGLLARVAPSGG